MKSERDHQLSCALWLQLLLFVLLTAESLTQEDCRYSFIRQPVHNLPCNPYLSAERQITTQCEVAYSSTEQAVDIQWLFRPLSMDTPAVIVSRERHAIVEFDFASLMITRSTLVISRLDISSSAADAGGYSCRALFPNGTATNASQELSLFAESVFASFVDFGACSTNDPMSVELDTCILAKGESLGGGVSEPEVTTMMEQETTTMQVTTPAPTTQSPTTQSEVKVTTEAEEPTTASADSSTTTDPTTTNSPDPITTSSDSPTTEDVGSTDSSTTEGAGNSATTNFIVWSVVGGLGLFIVIAVVLVAGVLGCYACRQR